MKKKNIVKILFAAIFTIIVILFLTLFFSSIESSDFIFSCYNIDNNEPLDGKLVLNNKLLGHFVEGQLIVNKSSLGGGELIVETNYKEEIISIAYEFYYEDISSGSLDLTVTTDDLEDAFNNKLAVKNLNIEAIERGILNLANIERKKYQLPLFKHSGLVSNIEKEYMKEILITKDLQHKDPEGKVFGDKLKERGIFYLVSAENLALIPFDKDMDIAEEFIQGWLNSPAHRSTLLDRDNIFSHVGVAVECDKEDLICYGALGFMGLERSIEIEDLEKNYGTFIYVYEPSLPFNFDVSVDVKVKSDKAFNVYLVPSSYSFDEWSKGRSFKTLNESKFIFEYHEYIKAKKSYGLIIEAPVYNDLITAELEYTEYQNPIKDEIEAYSLSDFM